jgi:hypothetical protein
MSNRLLALALVAALGIAACGGASESGPTAASPAAPAASIADLKVLTPSDGDVVAGARITFAGTAPAGTRVVRDIALAPDDEVVATDGTWTLDVELVEGVNEIVLRLGDDESTAQTFSITYAPVAAAPTASATPEPTPTPTPDPTPTPTPDPTPAPTPDPTPKPVEYKKLSNRSWQKLVKAPDKYIGRTYQVWACITQFDAATGEDTFRGEASNKKRTYWFLDGDNALFTGSEAQLAEFVQDDVVAMRVTTLGSFSYDTQIGGNTTVPWFSVDRISRKGSCD